MRQKKPIDIEELKELKADGWSYAQLAVRYRVGKSTIKRRFKSEMRANKDAEVMEFAKKLQKLAAETPAGYCRAELMRLVNHIRTYQAMTAEQKRQLVLGSIESGAREVEEIAEDCQFTKSETAQILDEMCELRLVEKRPRGGKLNRGRKMKFHWLISRLVHGN